MHLAPALSARGSAHQAQSSPLGRLAISLALYSIGRIRSILFTRLLPIQRISFASLKPGVWNDTFASLGRRIGGVLDFGIARDATQNLLWRIENGELDFGAGQPQAYPKIVVVCICTNNILLNTVYEVVN